MQMFWLCWDFSAGIISSAKLLRTRTFRQFCSVKEAAAEDEDSAPSRLSSGPPSAAGRDDGTPYVSTVAADIGRYTCCRSASPLVLMAATPARCAPPPVLGPARWWRWLRGRGGPSAPPTIPTSTHTEQTALGHSRQRQTVL